MSSGLPKVRCLRLRAVQDRVFRENRQVPSHRSVRTLCGRAKRYDRAILHRHTNRFHRMHLIDSESLRLDCARP